MSDKRSHRKQGEEKSHLVGARFWSYRLQNLLVEGAEAWKAKGVISNRTTSRSRISGNVHSKTESQGSATATPVNVCRKKIEKDSLPRKSSSTANLFFVTEKTEIASKMLRPGRHSLWVSKGQLEDDAVTGIIQEPQVTRKSSDNHVASFNNRNLTLWSANFNSEMGTIPPNGSHLCIIASPFPPPFGS